MIPANIDYVALIRELVTFGYGPYQLDRLCGLYEGAISDILKGRSREMTYSRTAKLYNFWWKQKEARSKMRRARR